MAQKLGNVAVGTVLKLNENGSPVQFYVSKQDYETTLNGPGRVLLVRKDAYDQRQWDTSNSNAWASCAMRSWLNDTYLNLFDADIRALIGTTKYYYTPGKSNITVTTRSDAVFLLSLTELGQSSPYANVEGSALPIANTLKIAYQNGSATKQWTRTPLTVNINNVFFLNTDGSVGGSGGSIVYGSRPAFTLPYNLIVDDNGNITPNVVPTAPASITVPTTSVPSGSSVNVSWTVGTNATGYILQRRVNGGSWQTVYTGTALSYSDTALDTWTLVQYQVASTAFGFTSSYQVSATVTILPYTVKTLTAPSQVMEGQQIPVSWSAVTAANTYVLERKSSAADWAQIYSGGDTQFTDAAGSGWTSVQYRVKAGKDGTFGPYKTSPEIPVISASALVISGQDGDLGTLTEDVPYTVSSDTGNPITLERYVNGILVTRITVESGFAYSIPVMELPTGANSIKLVCTVTPPAGGPVTATRLWGYTKAVVLFPDEGGPAVLEQDGKTVLPVTLAECIKTPVNWGGSLDKALELLSPLLSTAVMATGSYVGTGTFGQDSPNELSFDFDPEIVIVSGGSERITISNKEPSGGQTDGYIQNQTATWYSTSAAKQLNVQGELYSYWAVGKAVQT